MLDAALLACMMQAADAYNVPAAVLRGIYEVEGGRVGQAVGPNRNGTYDLGPMQINTLWIPKLAEHWNVDYKTAYNAVKNDGCVNMSVSAWILAGRIRSTGNLTMGIAHYHSATPKFGHTYAKKVIAAMRRLGLVQ